MVKLANRLPNTSRIKTASKSGLKKTASAAKRSVRPILKTIGMALALLLMLTSAAVTYTYMSGRDSEEELASKSTATTAPKPTPPPSVKAPVVNPKTKAFAVIEMLDSAVKSGQPVTMTIHTNPHAKCSLEVDYRPKDGSASKLQARDAGLKDQTADEFGLVEWDWRFSSGLPTGNWRATATCAIKDQSAVVFGDITLK
ncbi:MAG TPA: hypothetical protein VFK03_00580 [Candidatus Saccharimonadales bacterium]|nr:hypothetical protein [Candidatus Saccharimonadales bacterium]